MSCEYYLHNVKGNILIQTLVIEFTKLMSHDLQLQEYSLIIQINI